MSLQTVLFVEYMVLLPLAGVAFLLQLRSRNMPGQIHRALGHPGFLWFLAPILVAAIYGPFFTRSIMFSLVLGAILLLITMDDLFSRVARRLSSC